MPPFPPSPRMMGHHAAACIFIVFNGPPFLPKSAGPWVFLVYFLINLAVQNKNLLVSLILIM